MHIDRRRFLKTAAAATAAGTLITDDILAGSYKAEVYVVHGTDVKKMLAKGIDRFGGWKTFVRPGQKVAIKANATWPRRPETGANTDPVLAGACVAGCKAAGAKSIIVPDNVGNEPEKAFKISGIKNAVEGAGGSIFGPRDMFFRQTALPRGKVLKTVEVASAILDADCLINLPVAKHHEATGVTVSMKNWMGSVKDPRAWHRTESLHQCIADFNSFIKPHLIIIDATRIMLSNGPRGPGELAYPQQIILSKDPVAADAYAATLFGRKPFEIDHIKLAHDMKIGCGDLARVKVTNI
jgi:uncharacterized protein (DUF362 family)